MKTWIRQPAAKKKLAATTALEHLLEWSPIFKFRSDLGLFFFTVIALHITLLKAVYLAPVMTLQEKQCD